LSKNILLYVGLVCLSQLIFWFQVNGQFLWEFFRKYPYIIALMGLPSGYLVIIASKYGYQGFDGEIWPMRIIGFSSGTVIGAILLYALMDEGLTVKTILCLLLSLIIIIIQIAL